MSKILMNTINPDWTIYEQAVQCPPPGWEDVFNDSLDALENISNILETDAHKYHEPVNAYVFNAFWMCPLDKVRVIIWGQDPYPTPGVANGMSFSTHPGMSIPGSLRNIFNEIRRQIPTFIMPTDGYLGKWAEQGILLLNSRYTFSKLSPCKGNVSFWDSFNYVVCERVFNINPDVIVVAWGQKAQAVAKNCIPKAFTLTCPHPSSMNSRGGFEGNGHFIAINNKLRELGQPEIDWNTH